MKTFTRLMAVAVALSAGLFFAGCTTTVSKAIRPRAVVEFVVVQSSTKKELTPTQLAELQEAVRAYLREHGLTDNRTYYVEVQFPAANPGDEPQWAIVRINNRATQAFTVIAAYPGADDNYPYDYSGSGYFSRGYYGFSRYDYHDPYYSDPGKYYPPKSRGDHARPHQPEPKRDHPPGTQTRWDRHPRNDGDPPRAPVTPPRSPDGSHKKRNHDPDHERPRDDYAPHPVSGASRDYSPPVLPRAEPVTAYSAPARDTARSEPAQSRTERDERPENEK